MDNASERDDRGDQSKTSQQPTFGHLSRSVFPEDYRSLAAERPVPSRLAEVLLSDPPDHKRSSDLARMRLNHSLYTDLDDIIGRSASHRLHSSPRFSHAGPLRSNPHTRSISVPATQKLPKVRFESPLDSDLVPSDIPTNTNTTNSPHQIGNIANNTVVHPETIQPQTGKETSTGPNPAVPKNDDSLFKDLTLILKNSRPFRPSAPTPNPPSVRSSNEQQHHPPTLDALNPRSRHPRQQSISSSDITTTPLHPNTASQQHHAAHRPWPADSPIPKSPSCPHSDADCTDLPAQSFPGKSSPLLPPPAPSPPPSRQIKFPRPFRRRLPVLEPSLVQLPPSPPPEFDFSNFETCPPSANLLDDSPSMPVVKTPTDSSRPLIDLDTELPLKPKPTKTPFAQFSPLPSPVISERPFLASVISSHSSDNIPRRGWARFRSACPAAGDIEQNGHCATPKPEPAAANEVPVDPELLASIQKLDDRLSTIDPVQAQSDPPVEPNTVPSAPPFAEPPAGASGKPPGNPTPSVTLAAQAATEPLPPADAPGSQSRPPGSEKIASSVPPSNRPERRAHSVTRSVSRAPSAKAVVQPLTEAALRIHSSASHSARQRSVTATGLARSAAPPNAKGSPRPTDLARSPWSPGHSKDDEISSLIDTFAAREAGRAKKLRDMLRDMAEQENEREREFELLGDRVRGRGETRMTELAGAEDGSMFGGSPRASALASPRCEGSASQGVPAESVGEAPAESVAGPPTDKPTDKPTESHRGSKAPSVLQEVVAMTVRAASAAASARAASLAGNIRAGSRVPSVRTEIVSVSVKKFSAAGTAKAVSAVGTIRAESVVNGKAPSAVVGEKTPSEAAGSLREASKPPSLAGTGKQGSVAGSIRPPLTTHGSRAPSVATGSKAPTARAPSVAATVRTLPVAQSSHAPSGGPSAGVAESKAPSVRAESVPAPTAKDESVAAPSAQEEPVGEPSAKGESAAPLSAKEASVAPSGSARDLLAASIALADSIVQSAKPEETPAEEGGEPAVEHEGEPAADDVGEPVVEGGEPAAEEGGEPVVVEEAAPAAAEGEGAGGGRDTVSEGENKENEGSLVGQVIGDREPSVRRSSSTPGTRTPLPRIVPLATNLPGKWIRDGPAGFKFVLIP